MFRLPPSPYRVKAAPKKQKQVHTLEAEQSLECSEDTKFEMAV